MASETDPVLARIQAKIDAWQAAAESYRAALALEQGPDAAAFGEGGRARPVVELPVGAFRGMTITEAVKLYLQSVRRKQSVQEIADGLRAGGIESTAKDFGPTLRSILHQLKKRGELLRFKDGWDLAEAHSTALRNRLAKDTSRPKSPVRKAKAGTKKAAKRATKRPTKGNGPKGPSPDERIQAFLGSKPLEWFTPKQVAEALKEDPSKLSLAFARLVRYGRIAKQDDGRFAAAKK
jgi:hypothetical protein